MVKTIKLTQGQVTLVDDEDYETLNQHNWHVIKCTYGNTYYAKRNLPAKPGDTRKLETMHRRLVNAPDDMQVGHLNHNTLDNRKSNLIICPTIFNQRRKVNSLRWFVNGVEYKSCTDASTQLGISRFCIQMWCRGRNHGKYRYPPKENCYTLERE